jgi:tyrosine-protein kinase
MDSPLENSVSPLDYLRPIWRFKWAALVMVTVAVGATYVYFDHQPRTYETSTQLYVGQSSIDSLTGTSNPAVDARSLANQARLVTTPAVASVVIRRLGLATTPERLLQRISVRPDASADFLTIVADAPSARLAAQLVNGFAQAYILNRAEQERRLVNVQLKTAQLQLARTPIKQSNLPARVSLAQRIQDLRSAALNPEPAGQQLSSAQPPAAAVAPRPGRNAIFAGALAFLLAIVLAYLFDRSDTRLRTVDEMESMLDTAILATIPHVAKPLPVHGERDHIIRELREPYHTLRVNLELIRARRGNAQSLLVTSAFSGEGKSTTVRNLALAYRDAGMRVAVVDADLRRSSIADLFDLARGPGTAEVLGGSVRLHDAIQADQTAARTTGRPRIIPEARKPTRQAPGRLDVLTAGDPGENPGLLFYPVAVRELVNELRTLYDIVLVDTPPVLLVSDALALAPEVDGVILVARVGVTTDTSAQRLVRTLAGVPQTQIMGAVVNAVATGEYAYYGAYEPIDRHDDARPSANGAPDPRDGVADPALRK